MTAMIEPKLVLITVGSPMLDRGGVLVIILSVPPYCCVGAGVVDVAVVGVVVVVVAVVGCVVVVAGVVVLDAQALIRPASNTIKIKMPITVFLILLPLLFKIFNYPIPQSSFAYSIAAGTESQ
jgi:hypothetical protein